MHVMCHMHYYAERPDGERVMFFMYVTRNLSIYNHLDQEGLVYNHMPRRGYLLIAKGIFYVNIYPARGFLSTTSSFHLMPLMLIESPYGALYRVGTRIFLLTESP